MEEQRLLKKYPNRRLYDTKASCYITLKEVKALIHDNIRIKVVDRQTDEDITRTILLQIIMEQESDEGDEPLFSSDMLYHFIRNYSDAQRSSFTEYLENSLDFFAGQQKNVQEQLGKSFAEAAANPVEFWLNMSKTNLRSAQEVQQKMMDTVLSSATLKTKAEKANKSKK